MLFLTSRNSQSIEVTKYIILLEYDYDQHPEERYLIHEVEGEGHT